MSAPLAIQPDGKILAAGLIELAGLSTNFGLARYLPNGNLETSFNFDGVVATDFARSEDNGSAVALQTDGKIVIAGTVFVRGTYDFAVARYFGDVGPTKFFVVDRAADNTFEYDAEGDLVKTVDLAPGNANSKGADSNADGSRIWVVNQNGAVFVYDAAGTLLGSWTAAGLSNPEGIAVNASGAYIVDGDLDKVFFYAGGQNLLAGSHAATADFSLLPGNSNPKGLAADNNTLWVVDDGASLDKVYLYAATPLGIGTPKGSWVIDPANSSPSGITINPAQVDDIWILDSDDKKTYLYAHAASKTFGWQVAVLTHNLHPGQVNPQGIADPSGWLPANFGRLPGKFKPSSLLCPRTPPSSAGFTSICSGDRPSPRAWLTGALCWSAACRGPRSHRRLLAASSTAPGR